MSYRIFNIVFFGIVCIFLFSKIDLNIHGSEDENKTQDLIFYSLDENRYFHESKTSSKGLEAISQLYGPYRHNILNNEIKLSPKILSEFSIPQLKIGDEIYRVVETPSLRFDLWKIHQPDIVLMGSSMMFVNFTRSRFFEDYPNKYLVDFTMGNNHPKVTEFLLAKLVEENLDFDKNTIFVYGLNIFELQKNYSENSHDHVYEFFNDEDIELSYQEKFEQYINKIYSFNNAKVNENISYINKVFAKFNNFVANLSSEILINLKLQNRYIIEIPRDRLLSAEAIKKYLSELVTTSRVIKSNDCIDELRLEKLSKIINFIKSKEADIIFVKPPTSTLDYLQTKSCDDYFNIKMKKFFEDHKVKYLDLSSHDDLEISDLDFIFNVNKLDPQHLNYAGGRKFVEKIVQYLKAVNF